jgi:hypothetical protein
MDIKIDQAGHIRPASFDGIRKNGGFGEILNGKITEMNRAAPSSVNPDRDLLDHSVKVLDLLEDYAGELKNPHKSLKEIEPLVTRIENEIGVIGLKADGTASGDREVGQFVRELSVTANVAVLKFRRGDYL